MRTNWISLFLVLVLAALTYATETTTSAEMTSSQKSEVEAKSGVSVTEEAENEEEDPALLEAAAEAEAEMEAGAGVERRRRRWRRWWRPRPVHRPPPRPVHRPAAVHRPAPVHRPAAVHHHRPAAVHHHRPAAVHHQPAPQVNAHMQATFQRNAANRRSRAADNARNRAATVDRLRKQYADTESRYRANTPKKVAALRERLSREYKQRNVVTSQDKADQDLAALKNRLKKARAYKQKSIKRRNNWKRRLESVMKDRSELQNYVSELHGQNLNAAQRAQLAFMRFNRELSQVKKAAKQLVALKKQIAARAHTEAYRATGKREAKFQQKAGVDPKTGKYIPAFQTEADGSPAQTRTLELGKVINPEDHGKGLIKKDFQANAASLNRAETLEKTAQTVHKDVNEAVKDIIASATYDATNTKVTADLAGFLEVDAEADVEAEAEAEAEAELEAETGVAVERRRGRRRWFWRRPVHRPAPRPVVHHRPFWHWWRRRHHRPVHRPAPRVVHRPVYRPVHRPAPRPTPPPPAPRYIPPPPPPRPAVDPNIALQKNENHEARTFEVNERNLNKQHNFEKAKMATTHRDTMANLRRIRKNQLDVVKAEFKNKPVNVQPIADKEQAKQRLKAKIAKVEQSTAPIRAEGTDYKNKYRNHAHEMDSTYAKNKVEFQGEDIKVDALSKKLVENRKVADKLSEVLDNFD